MMLLDISDIFTGETQEIEVTLSIYPTDISHVALISCGQTLTDYHYQTQAPAYVRSSW